MTDHLAPFSDREARVGTFVGGMAAGVGLLLVGGVVISIVLGAVLGLLSLVVPFALILGGLSLVAYDRRILGWSAVGLGGLLVLGELPLLLLAAAIAGGVWLATR